MNIKNISYPTPLDIVTDIENDNIDVCVELENGFSMTLVVTTPKNLLWYMNKENREYIEAGSVDIIVKSLTEDNIRMAIETYTENNAYWLKLYYVAGLGEGIFPIEQLDKIIQESLDLD
ncbi:hypothetical protein HNQ80_001125 [Anaerosolibacter carboniphilus]|uniref:Uncharacterized protein n=1 Tax=Anaerosolibacter carboniphilus TaxID=1417629 RepID=A0A841KNN1_9FIRM|nr:hypothetical protein [Anaerosolibacter carboniphilus]MBB6215036.1 hypothetical protein [Anaerosolibacter carboniphilus]